jgi:hypothetical protein
MSRTIQRSFVAAWTLAALAGASRAEGQDLSVSSAFEAAGDEVYVVFVQPSVAFGPEVGWGPDLRVGAYRVWTSGNDGWGITPAVGLTYRTEAGLIGGSVGWAIRDDENGIAVFGGADNGLHTGLHTEYWGDGTWGLQGIANYNWGGDFLWSRARVTRRIAGGGGGGSTALGAELVWQAQADDDDAIDGNEYEATYIGPVLQLIRPSGANWALSGGLKMTEPTDDSTWYAKVELYLP